MIKTAGHCSQIVLQNPGEMPLEELEAGVGIG
jgi:hypothetical protein